MKLYDLIIKEIFNMGIAVESENETDASRIGTSRCLLKVKENPEYKNLYKINLIIEEAKSVYYRSSKEEQEKWDKDCRLLLDYLDSRKSKKP